MIQENFDRIAKIINKNTAPPLEQYDDLSIVGECLKEDLADYFEELFDDFDREDFLEKCGE